MKYKIDWRKKNEATVKYITVACPCGKNHRLDPKHVHFHVDAWDGGEFGYATSKVDLEYWCPNNLDTPLRSLKVTLYDN